jgi:hypothetical protein
VRWHSEAGHEQRAKLVGPGGSVLHGPAVLGVAGVRDGVSGAEQYLPELHQPGRDVGRQDIGQGNGRAWIDEAVRPEDEPSVPGLRQEHRVLGAVARAQLLVGRVR